MRALKSIGQCGTLYTIWFPRTLQFCLWGFLRDLGESSVGGVEVIRSLKDNDVEFDVKIHVAFADKERCQSIHMVDSQRLLRADDLQGEPGKLMQGVYFTMLKPQTRNFLKELFIHSCLSPTRFHHRCSATTPAIILP
jgi:nucleolar MIF4G domain-containing protein 1